MSYRYVNETDAVEILNGLLGQMKRTCWFGAISFEDRCVASVLWLQRNGLRLHSAIALNYPTEVLPQAEDKRRREANRKTFQSAAKSVFSDGWREITLEPYAFQSIQTLVAEAAKAEKIDFAVFDVTCMTKIHALGLAATLATTLEGLSWVIAYSSPENYGNLDSTSRRLGWKDIIVAPIAETAVLLYEAHSRGVIVAGHEAERLIVALAEIEPSGGVVVIGESPKRPDVGRLSERVNSRVVRNLMKLQSSRWEKVSVSVGNISQMDLSVEGEIREAKQYNAPVILFPNGPKSLIFFAALKLCKEYANGSWFVYPVPAGYDVNYSEGTAGISWLVPNT